MRLETRLETERLINLFTLFLYLVWYYESHMPQFVFLSTPDSNVCQAKQKSVVYSAIHGTYEFPS